MMIKNKVVEKNVCKKIVKLKLFGKVILITSSKRAPFYVIYVNNVSCIYIRLCIHTQIEYLIVHIYTNILKPRRQKKRHRNSNLQQENSTYGQLQPCET